MDPLTISAAGGLRARMESLDMLANNIANSATGGYKGDREFYSLYASAEADQTSALPMIDRPWTDFSQGPLRATGNPLDLALSGKGFFAVNGPSGPLYTRNGSFMVSAAGQLTTADGYAVRATGGGPITLDAKRDFTVIGDGTVMQEGQPMGQLEIVDFANPAALAKQGSSYFTANPAAQPLRPTATEVQQGRLEGSNVAAAESAVRLVSVMRQFEMLQKAITLGGEMNRKATEEVARVGS